MLVCAIGNKNALRYIIRRNICPITKKERATLLCLSGKNKDKIIHRYTEHYIPVEPEQYEELIAEALLKLI